MQDYSDIGLTLSEQIDELRLQMVADHQHAMSKARDLARLAVESDAALMQALEAIIDGQKRRAADIRRTMDAILFRSAEPISRHVVGISRHVASRSTPPLRAESTSGEALDLYDGKASKPC